MRTYFNEYGGLIVGVILCSIILWIFTLMINPSSDLSLRKVIGLDNATTNQAMTSNVIAAASVADRDTLEGLFGEKIIIKNVTVKKGDEKTSIKKCIVRAEDYYGNEMDVCVKGEEAHAPYVMLSEVDTINRNLAKSYRILCKFVFTDGSVIRKHATFTVSDSYAENSKNVQELYGDNDEHIIIQDLFVKVGDDVPDIKDCILTAKNKDSTDIPVIKTVGNDDTEKYIYVSTEKNITTDNPGEFYITVKINLSPYEQYIKTARIVVKK